MNFLTNVEYAVNFEGKRCPNVHCKSEDVEATEGLQHDGVTVTQQCRCVKCGLEYEDRWELRGYRIIDSPEKAAARKLIEDGGDRCVNPECRSIDLEKGEHMDTGDAVWRDIECLDCGSTWSECTRLVDVSDVNIVNKEKD